MLAPGIYRTARDHWGDTGSAICRVAKWTVPYPARPQKANQMVLEQQPAGPECRPPSSPSEQPLGYERKPASKASWPPAPLLGHIQSTPQFLDSPLGPRTPLLASLPHRLLGFTHGTTGLVACNGKGMLFCLGEAHGPPQQVWDRADSHPSTQNKRTNKRKQTATEESHPGWRRRAEAPSRGLGSSYECIRPGRCERKGEGERKR